jgi:hypothetical protein
MHNPPFAFDSGETNSPVRMPELKNDDANSKCGLNELIGISLQGYEG